MSEKPQKIKKRVDEYNRLIESLLQPNTFVLNNLIVEYGKEIGKLQAQCPHEFQNGYCIYCYKAGQDNTK